MSKWIDVEVRSVNKFLVELEDDEPEENAYDVVENYITYEFDEMECCDADIDTEEELVEVKRFYNKENIISL